MRQFRLFRKWHLAPRQKVLLSWYFVCACAVSLKLKFLPYFRAKISVSGQLIAKLWLWNLLVPVYFAMCLHQQFEAAKLEMTLIRALPKAVLLNPLLIFCFYNIKFKREPSKKPQIDKSVIAQCSAFICCSCTYVCLYILYLSSDFRKAWCR